MQFLVQSQDADVKGPDGPLSWRDFANGEILDKEPVGLRCAVARTTPIEQIAEIIPRA
jgi:hypothetical protein